MKGCKRVFALFLSMLLCGGTLAYADGPEGSTGEGIAVLKEEDFSAIVEKVIAEKAPVGAKVSVAYRYLQTGESAYYNADEWYYSASLYKLPMIMSYSHMLLEGEPEGLDTMFLTDPQTIMHRCLVYSDNSWSLALVRYVFPQFNMREMDAELASFPEEELPENYDNNSIYSARFVLGILQELYSNPEDYPNVIDYMCEAQPDKYFHGKLGDSYVIAQKYGSTKEVAHAAGIIFTPNPCLLVVMTEHAGINLGERVIAEMAEALVDYTLTLDSSYETALEEKRLEEARLEEERRKVEAEARAAEEAAAAAECSQESVTEESPPFPLPAAAYAACFVAGALTVFFFLHIRRKRKKAP